MSKIYDAVVIGSGAAGIATAVIARRSGASILVVEKDGFGGTCPLRGCIPKKILSAAAESMACINRAPEHRISVRGADLNWKELIDLKRSMIRDVPAKSRDRFHSLGIDTVQVLQSLPAREASMWTAKNTRAKRSLSLQARNPGNCL
ncbi:MAG TPA: FAD-dependent oxidoreductase [Deltaproteobacteria bacterium]|nr:FAD-dependent oxidoreductase [Deltaproteobacteria bacterium]